MAAGLRYVEEADAVAATIVAPLPLPVTTTQLPAALVGGRLDVNVGAALPAGANTIGAVTSAQLPAALVGGRLDENVGAWLGSTAPTVGQKAMASSVPVVVASDQSNLPTKEVRAGTSAFSAVAANAGSVTLLAANANRLGATIVKEGGSGFLYVILNASAASSSNFTVRLSNFDYYEVPFNYTGEIRGIWTAAVGSAVITEMSA